jgi:TPR repeat protein
VTKRASIFSSLVPLATVAFFSLLACAVPSTYMGIPLDAGVTSSGLQSTALRARAGDKNAQWELGKAFEEGIGVPRNLHNAMILYQKAAMESGGLSYIYQPSGAKGEAGALMSVENGPIIPGNRLAKERLDALKRK